MTDCHLDPLIKLQKRVLRLICHVGYSAHTNKVFYSCNILELKDDHKFQLAVHMYILNSSTTVDHLYNHNYNTRYTDNLVPYFTCLSVTHSILFCIMDLGFGMSSHAT